MTAATGILLPEQEEFQGPIKTGPMEKRQVLTEEREVMLPSPYTPKGGTKRRTKVSQASSKHPKLFEQAMPTKGGQSKRRLLRVCCQPESQIEEVAGV